MGVGWEGLDRISGEGGEGGRWMRGEEVGWMVRTFESLLRGLGIAAGLVEVVTRSCEGGDAEDLNGSVGHGR